MGERTKAVQLLIEHIEKLRILADELKDEHDIDVISLISKPAEGIPLSVFKTKKLSALEIIVKYLKENQSKSYHQIAELLNRDDRTIWSTYNNSLNKYTQKLIVKPSINIPFSILSSRKYSVLESITIYLKDQLNYSFKKISSILLKDYQTIYTSYRRGKLKYEK